jgi:hypothetical protein
MNETNLACCQEPRRDDVRNATGRYGLDYLEVSQDQRVLTVTFLGHAPNTIKKENIRIEGGVRVSGVSVTDITFQRFSQDTDLDDTMDVTVSQPGDFSTYTLRVAALDDQGQPTSSPPDGFDLRYDRIAFTFKAACPSDLDCKSPCSCPPETRSEPEINYLAKDYDSFRQLILDRLALLVPGWTERHVPDIGITLVELLAYAGDYLSYYQDAVATEAYLQTARERISVRRHVRLVDYPMHEGCNARTWIFLWSDSDLQLNPADIKFITAFPNAPADRILVPKDLEPAPPGSYLVFEPLVADPTASLSIYAAHSSISFYTWGDRQCCLAKGATSATLIDKWLTPSNPVGTQDPTEPPSSQSPAKPRTSQAAADETPQRTLNLHVGDILIFEEVLGPKTGVEADADPTHRRAVRLTLVQPGVDTLYNSPDGQPFVYIEWAREDALTFALCISSITQGPDCKYITDVTVARGNVFLIDHGAHQAKTLGPVPTQQSTATCGCECEPAEITVTPALFRPESLDTPLTFSEKLRKTRPASSMLLQDPRNALPWLHLVGEVDEPTGTIASQWTARRDLLESGGTDRDFVVEMDNNGGAHLRFGDGDLGEMPAAGMSFAATYRIGNGPSGNVGAETLTYIVFSNNVVKGASLKPRNPFAAIGGTAPEPLAEIKLLAPHAFRSVLERAITPQDYATLAQRSPRLQRATAQFEWTGSWYEAAVVVDPIGTEDPSHQLLDHVDDHLYRYRRVGYDLSVRHAQYVSLDLKLSVCVRSDYLRGHVEAALLNVFSSGQLANGSLGFFHPDNLTFGEGVYVSKIVAAAQAVTGVDSVTVKKLNRLFEAPNHELQNGILPLGPYEIARLDNNPSFPENGRLVLDLRGGR